MDEAWTVIVSLISAKTLALLGLWLRLRWRARLEQQRQRYLLQVTETVAAGRQVELDDRDGGGHHLRVMIHHVPGSREVEER
ncbi:hypothetical protein AB0I94_35795 [Streptomyces sp. NPDC050147]|uniref:hypothetical protein n=1 Tax=Streptomyces sp. NPDC050147 TaxID=3155513 RepID=UPI00343ADB21